MIKKIKYLFSQYRFSSMIFDYRFGKCSNIPKCCIWWYLLIWSLYDFFGKCEQYSKGSRAYYIQCPFCKKKHRKPNRLKMCEKCKKKDGCDMWVRVCQP